MAQTVGIEIHTVSTNRFKNECSLGNARSCKAGHLTDKLGCWENDLPARLTNINDLKIGLVFDLFEAKTKSRDISLSLQETMWALGLEQMYCNSCIPGK